MGTCIIFLFFASLVTPFIFACRALSSWHCCWIFPSYSRGLSTKTKTKKHSSTSISYTPPRFSFLGSLVLCRKRKTFRILSSYFSSSQKFILLCVWAISSIRNCKTRSDFSFQKLSLNVPLFPNFLPLRFFLFCFLVSISSHFKFLRVAFQIIICRANVKCPCRVDVPVDFR